MTDKAGDIVYTHPMITEVSLKNRLGSDLSKFIIDKAKFLVLWHIFLSPLLIY